MSVNLIESRMCLFSKACKLALPLRIVSPFFTLKWDEKKQRLAASGMLLHTFLSFHLCISLAGKKEGP